MTNTAAAPSRREAFSKAIHSIRTRNALVTGTFLFLFLGVFYVGGRWMLANLVRDTASQVRDAGMFVSSRIQRQTDGLREAITAALGREDVASAPPESLVGRDGSPFSFVARFGADGTFRDGAAVLPRHRGLEISPAPAALSADDFAAYADELRDWARAASAAGDGAPSAPFEIGILRVEGRLHYAAFARLGDSLTLFAVPFSAESFARLDGDHGSQLNITVGAAPKQAAAKVSDSTCAHSGGHVRTSLRSRAGISPMFTETSSSGADPSFWGFRSDPLETVFVLRDISGNAISELSVSLPKAFSTATRMAMLQLAFYVALGGLLFVLPIFWAQSRILLNPLTRMTREIAALGARDVGLDCPRIVWRGRDEFALLAESVNRMVERIAAKTVSLANVEARHKALIECVPDALVVFDQQGRLVSVTKQAEGVDPLPQTVPGEPPPASVFGEAQVAEFRSAVGATFATGRPERVRLSALAADGAPRRHFEVRLLRMGELFVLGVVRDVTADVAEHDRMLAAEARAADASKRASLTEMAAGIAHDMNNVLAVVSNTVAESEATPDDDKAAAITSIRDAVRRGTSLMRELSAFAGENRMKFERASPKMILADVRELAERIVSDGVEVVFDDDGDAPDVDADLSQFWKVVFNLVKNASEAIGDRPGRITLGAKAMRMTRDLAATFVSESQLPEGDGAALVVTDDGPGIAPDQLARIFDPYVSTKGIGRGLGLATVRTIVEAHGGGIRISSAPQRGTEFMIWLPASRLPKPAPADGILSSAQPPAADRPRSCGEILVVDDDAAILKTTSILCRTAGIETHLAQNRREALSVVRRIASRLRAIVLDAHLGSFDTVRLLAAFRIGAPGVPVVVASGASEERMREMFRSHPYDAFLAKPYTLAELRAVLDRITG